MVKTRTWLTKVGDYAGARRLEMKRGAEIGVPCGWSGKNDHLAVLIFLAQKLTKNA
jgi:hypothetical protein